MPMGFAGRIARAFVSSKLTPLLIAASLGLGVLALVATPREEEPQIRVPMVDVTVAWPGASAAEIDTRLVKPIERAMWGISRVEHVYSTARPGVGMVTVRFAVNESNEESLVKVYERLSVLGPVLPGDATPPAVELHSIDDVPFLTLTLWSERASSDEIRPVAAQLAQELSEIPETSKAYLIGGQPRAIRVEPDPDRMAAAGVSFLSLEGALGQAGAKKEAGTLVRGNRETRIVAGPLFESADAVAHLVVGTRGGRPVYTSDVARVIDGPGEATNAVFYTIGAARATPKRPPGSEYPGVTIALAKRPGANASVLADTVLAKIETLRPRLLPESLHLEVTRNYGRTASDKSRELVEHLLIATLSVVILISLAMGWRSGLVIAIAVPVTLALTLFIYFLAGYTLNRVTLFALIFSIGILVDDAIVVVENIERHSRETPGEPLVRLAARAVDEVGNPTILATFTVIAAILPMAFVRGLMGPYMRPIPAGASAAMLFSLAVAFIVSPWAACRIFKIADGVETQRQTEGWQTRIYRRAMTALIKRPSVRWAFFAGILLILTGSFGLVWLGLVKVKMLPFDNKSEMQILVDEDAGTPVEVTLETAREMSDAVSRLTEVRDLEIYAGVAAPYNFNGLVRHYFLRRAPNRADIQVNLVSREERSLQSHDLAKRVRPLVLEIARKRHARVKVVEIPPGPPVLDTLVAEVYGPSDEARKTLAQSLERLFETTPGIVDVDTSLEAPREEILVAVDQERAGLNGLSTTSAVETASGPGEGREIGRLELSDSTEPVAVRLQLSSAVRGDLEKRLSLRLDGSGGAVSLGELAHTLRRPDEEAVLRKDLKRVSYVFADLAGDRESPIYALQALDGKLGSLQQGGGRIDVYTTEAPATSDGLALKWDGEWQITYEVFRDLGIAFAVVLVLIAVLVIGWFQSFSVPLAILLPIPLSLIGILPGHYLFGAFFTATSMIGFIAGAGIIVRNSIILVDFIELEVRRGSPLDEAVVKAGAVRFRPMLLTAAAVVVGSLVILFDPIFQGLAISLMMGEVAATFLSRMAVPVVYYLIARHRRADELLHEALATGERA